MQGIGWALNEEYIYDDDGRLENPGFLDYRMPVASDLPMIDTVIVEVPNPRHPYGVRGVGEVPIVPPMAAIANAIAQRDRHPLHRRCRCRRRKVLEGDRRERGRTARADAQASMTQLARRSVAELAQVMLKARSSPAARASSSSRPATCASCCARSASAIPALEPHLG